VESTDNSSVGNGCARRGKAEMAMLLDGGSRGGVEGKAIELKTWNKVCELAIRLGSCQQLKGVPPRGFSQLITHVAAEFPLTQPYQFFHLCSSSVRNAPQNIKITEQCITRREVTLQSRTGSGARGYQLIVI
jgi:hypothetical protein